MRTPGRHDVVGHPRELVDAEHRAPGRDCAQPQPGALEALDGAGAAVGPHDVVEHAEDAVEVDACWARRGGARAGAGAGRRRRRRPVRRRGRSPTRTTCDADAAARVAPSAARDQVGRRRRTGPSPARRAGPGRGSGTRCRGRCRASVSGGQSVSPGAALGAHGGQPRRAASGPCRNPAGTLRGMTSPELDLAADVVTLTAALCDIESVSGDEAAAGRRDRGGAARACPPRGDPRRRHGRRPHRARAAPSGWSSPATSTPCRSTRPPNLPTRREGERAARPRDGAT